MMKPVLSIACMALLALAGCAPSPAPAPPVKPAAQVPVPVVDAAAAVRAIRAASEGLDSAVQVQPLRDPAIDGFLKRAHDAEAAGDYAGAQNAANGALKLAPDAPDILQYLAEISVERGDWRQAEQLAMNSYSLGPHVGGLCARNWQTAVEVRTVLHDTAQVTVARQHLKECRVPPRVRM
ncbi:MAG: tetratricopeptide repeat protein [Rhodanobacter sp.]|nr:tetratricopeptide repeat protein [Rhodanobacter sp.]